MTTNPSCAVLKLADNLHTESGVPTPTFEDVFKALSFYNHNNPARMKSVNLLEKDSGSNHLEGSVETWSILCVMLWRALKPLRGTLGYEAFRSWHMSCREEYEAVSLSKQDLAAHLGCSLRTLNRHLNKTLDRVERELIEGGLVSPPYIAV